MRGTGFSRPRKLVEQASACLKKLALGELEALARALLSILLALMLARVAPHHAEFLQLGAQLNVELQQRPRDSQLGRAGLAGWPAARGGDQDVELVGGLRRQQRLPHDGPR